MFPTSLNIYCQDPSIAVGARKAKRWVSPFREFAKAFSHKPTRVSATGDDLANVRHDGKVDGFLYVVAETLSEQDLEELPGTDRTHWKTTRVLKMQLFEEVPLVDTEMLSDAESAELSKDYPGTGFWSTCRGDD